MWQSLSNNKKRIPIKAKVVVNEVGVEEGSGLEGKGYTFERVFL